MTDTLETRQHTSTSVDDPSTPPIPAPRAPVPAPSTWARSRRHGLVLAGLVGVLALGTAAATTIWLSASSTPTSTPSTAAPATDRFEVDQPGGSVFTQQVPSAATSGRWTDGYGAGSGTYSQQVPAAAAQDWTSGYAPGSGTYSQQVPAAAAQDWTSGYAPGSGTYSQQVPGAATNDWTEGYGAGGSTYAQQVPSAAR